MASDTAHPRSEVTDDAAEGALSAPLGVDVGVLVADDNADMRQYMGRVLGQVEVRRGGRRAALDGSRAAAGPGVGGRDDAGMDGFELLEACARTRTCRIPR